MKKLSDLDDDMWDLDEDTEDLDDDMPELDDDIRDLDDEINRGSFASKMILLAAAAAVAAIIVVIVIVMTTGKSAREAADTAAGSEVVEAEPMPDQTIDPLTDPQEDEKISSVIDSPELDESAETPDKTGIEEDAAGGAGEDTAQETTAENDAAQDPQAESMSSEQGTEVDIAQLLSSDRVAETEQVTVGIDVAKYQGTIDWAQVASSGIDFAMVRVGYRTDGSREICADTNARYNMQEAQKNGIKLGVYFFSTALDAQEAKEEADWVADYISQYQITYPVAYDCEGFDKPGSAQYDLTNAERTDIAAAFLQEIYNRGYTPMFYASMAELSGNAKWDTSRIENTYKIWVSQYPSQPYPDTPKSSYAGAHAMWQYTNRGTVAGIGTPVDVNVAYFGYEGTADAVNPETPEEAQSDPEALMNFTEVNETVTAKDSTNLRNIPSQGGDSTVLYTLQNGETAQRTGVSDSGWSRLNYDGKTVYAVSSYLTTDLEYQAPQPEEAQSGDGLKTKFTECSDQVTAKIEVNLRTLPSVTNPDSAVAAVLHNGEYVTRTGINKDYGWSRVDYNGQTLYCVSSYLTN